MNTGRDVFGHDRPGRWSVLYVLVDGVPLTTTAGASTPTELVAEVPTGRDGRRPRIALGTPLEVSWGWRGEVRSRAYEVRDVLTGDGVARWRLVALAPSTEGTRRATPRHALVAPAVLVVDGVRWVGETVDLSIGGLRLTFPAAPVGAAPPEEGAAAELAVLLDGVRTAVEVDVVAAAALAGGAVDVRVVVTHVEAPDRDRLAAVVRGAASREAPRDDQPNEVPVSAS